MNNKPVNKGNPKNIYCWHCEHFDRNVYSCQNKQSKHFLMHREYYHRCKYFEWRRDL